MAGSRRARKESSATSAATAASRRPLYRALSYGLTVAMASALIGGGVVVSTRKVLFDDVRDYLGAAATTGAALIETESHRRFALSQSENPAEYENAVRPLRAMLAANVSLRRVSSGVIDDNTIVYVLDATTTPPRAREPRNAVTGQRAPIPPLVRLMVARGTTVVEDTATIFPWGPGVQAAAPLRAPDGTITGFVMATLSLARYDGWIGNLDRVVFIGSAIGLVLALISALTAYRVERSRVEAERELKASKAAAEQNARAKGEFLANMSHEIRTPLHGVLGMSEAMLATSHTEADRRSLEVINKSASSLLGILNDILDYSKLEAGRVELINAPFDPRGLVDDVTDLFAVKAEEKGLEIAVRETIRAERWPVGDSARLKQVLLNLVGNAVKFTESGYVQVDLETVMIGRKTIAMRLAVKDTGIGIAEEAQGRLFEQFQQGEASTSRRFGGTGLGLAISRQLVMLMGGTLGVQSVEGKGTEFTVDLQLPVATTTREGPLSAGMLPGSRVLVACGLALTRQSIAESLARHGLVTETVSDHTAMVNRLRNGGVYAFIVADAPSIGDGSQPVLGGLRNAPPLVLLTSLHQPLNNSTLGSTGAAAQLRRPVREDHVVAILDDLVAGRLQPGGALARANELRSPPISDATLVAAARASGTPVPPAEVNGAADRVAPAAGSPDAPTDTTGAAATASGAVSEAADAAAAPANAAPTPAGPGHSTAPTPPAALSADAIQDGKPRVLVVDDVELNLMVARAMIGSLGAHVVSAHGGKQAIEILFREWFALVLMDCHMPEVDGYAVTRRVRSDAGPNSITPIVALSASAFAEDRQRALESGMNDFAPKPIELNGLRQVLGRWIPGFQPAGPKAGSTGA